MRNVGTKLYQRPKIAGKTLWNENPVGLFDFCNFVDLMSVFKYEILELNKRIVTYRFHLAEDVNLVYDACVKQIPRDLDSWAVHVYLEGNEKKFSEIEKAILIVSDTYS